MKIISLTAENIKRLTVVEIHPDGNLVQITGKNGVGKSSVLDSIWWALAGKEHIQKAPIREGEEQARIKLDLGDVIVTREFNRRETEDGETKITTKISVKSADGKATFNSPQTMLDKMVGELTFDPLDFARMAPKEQAEVLKRFVPDVDFAAMEEAHKADYEERTSVNTSYKTAKAAADAIPEQERPEPIDVADLTRQLEEAGRKNAEIDRQNAEIESNKRSAVDARERAAEIRATIEELKMSAENYERAAEDFEQTVWQDLGSPIDTSEIVAKIDSAKAVNDRISLLDRRDALLKEAEAHKEKSEAITARMKKRAEDRAKAIADAELPVGGLGLTSEGVTFNDLPFEQASDAEKLRISVAVAMAANPDLRVIRIRDGSLLDSDGMKLLSSMADENDYQIWIERVADGEDIGFVLEDGHLKSKEGESVSG